MSFLGVVALFTHLLSRSGPGASAWRYTTNLKTQYLEVATRVREHGVIASGEKFTDEFLNLETIYAFTRAYTQRTGHNHEVTNVAGRPR